MLYSAQNYLLHTATFLLGMILMSEPVSAQRKMDTVSIGIKAALDTAVANYPKIKAAQSDRYSAGEQLKSSQTAYIPTLQIQEQVTYGTANSVVGQSFPNEGTAIPVSGGITNSQNWNAASSQFTTAVLTGPIYAFGKITASINQRGAELKVADAVYQNEVFQHQIKVSESYLFLLVYQQLRQVQQQNLLRAIDVNNLIKAAVSSGLKPGIDSSFSAAEVSKAKITYLSSLRDEAEAQIKFGEYLGQTGHYYLVDTLGFNSSLPVANLAQSTINKNPLLGIYQGKIESDLFAAKAVRRSYLPTLKYLATTSARGSGISSTDVYSSSFSDGMQFQRYNYMVGAYFLWNVTDIFRTGHEYKSRMFNVQRDNELLDATTQRLNSQLENGNVQYGLSVQQAHEVPVQRQAATAGFNQSRARYQSGLGNLVELSQSLFLLARAEADYSITYNNTWRALLAVAAASGDMGLFLNAVRSK